VNDDDSFPPGFGPGTYGASFADVYDRWYHDISDAEATAAFVARRSSGTTVLELGVGTGRLVPHLTDAGLRVVGVDASREMLSGLGTSTPAHVLLADISSLPLRRPGPIGAVLCAFNTLFNLPTAALQQRALGEAAGVLAANGVVIVEAITGNGLADAESRSVGVSTISVGEVVLSATIVDHERQTVTGQHVQITEAGVRLRPWHLRWSTPVQLDRMAGAVGLKLVERYADWEGTAAGDADRSHVSVYARPA
jgi:SAM-dependent methyltransferase